MGRPERKEKPRRLFQDMNVKPYVYAISAVSVALAAIYISRGLNTQLHFLSPTDGERLKEVFLGNQSTWAILCHDNLAQPLYQPFEAAARKLHRQEGLQFGVIDCSAKLPAGKTTLQRFGLNKKIQPVIFVKSPENRKMRQLYPRYMSSSDALVRELVSVVTPQAVSVRDTKGLHEHCTSQELCLLVLRGRKFAGKEEVILGKVMKKYGAVAKFAMIDSLLHETSLEQRLPRFDPDVTRLIVFSRKDKSKVVKAKVYHGEFREKDLSMLLADASSGALSMRKVDGDIEVFKRTAAGKSRPQPPPRQDDAQTSSTSSSSAKTGESGATLSKEEEARLQAQKEAAIREAMERERDNFISFAGDEEDNASHGGEEDEEVLDLDEI